MTIDLALYVFFVQLVGFIVKGLVGAGNPLITVPLLSFVFNNTVISPSTVVLDAAVNTGLVWKNRRALNYKTGFLTAAFNLMGSAIGTVFLKVAAPWTLKAVLGLFIIGLGIEMATRTGKPPQKDVFWVRVLVAVLSGLMAGLFGINMLLMAYFERVAESSAEFRINACFNLLIENLFRIVLYAINGMFSMQTLSISLISVPAVALGIFIGARIHRHVSEKTAKKSITALFILGGVSILLYAVIPHM